MFLLRSLRASYGNRQYHPLHSNSYKNCEKLTIQIVANNWSCWAFRKILNMFQGYLLSTVKMESLCSRFYPVICGPSGDIDMGKTSLIVQNLLHSSLYVP